LLDSAGNAEATALMLQVPPARRNDRVGFTVSASGTVSSSGGRQLLSVTPNSLSSPSVSMTTTAPTGPTTTPQPTPAPVVEVLDESVFQHCQNFLQLRFCWSLDSAETSIHGSVRGPANGGFIGFGVTDQRGGRMVNADMLILVNNPFDRTVKEHFSTGFFTPTVKNSQALVNSTKAFLTPNSELVMQFNRSLSADGSATSNAIPLPEVEMIFAFSTSGDMLMYHGSNRGTLQVNLRDGTTLGTSSGTATLVVVHATLMGIAWAVAAIIGVFVASFVPKSKAWWFPLHVSMVSITALLTVIAFGIIVSYVNSVTGQHFTSKATSNTAGAHQVIGLIVFILIWIQICLGIIIDRVWKSKHAKMGEGEFPATSVLDRVHWWSGRLLMVLALVNMLLGAIELGSTAAIAVLATVKGVAIILYIILMIRRCVLKKREDVKDEIKI
jgi:hypothetical protein